MIYSKNNNPKVIITEIIDDHFRVFDFKQQYCRFLDFQKL